MAAGMAVVLALLGSSFFQAGGRPAFLDLDNFPQTSALLLLKATLDPSGNSLPAWTTTTQPCTWPGLTCNQQGQVTSINLAGRELTGELPRDNRVWGALPAVTSVNLANNSIYGWVAPELSDLQQIQSLDLAHNSFQGPLAGMANLTRLENVSLAGNELTGTLPASWANNTSLRTLNLSDNNFTGSLPQQWAALSQLQTLNASRNTLSGTIPSSWSNGSMHSLTALVLGGNDMLCQAQSGRASSVVASLQMYQDPCSPAYSPMLAPAAAPALAPYLAPATAPMAEMAPVMAPAMAPAPAPLGVAAPGLVPMMAPVPAPMAAAAPVLAPVMAPVPAPVSMAAPVLAPMMAPAPVAAAAPELLAPAPAPMSAAAPEMAPAMAPGTATTAPEQAPAPAPGQSMQQSSTGTNVSLQLSGITAAQFASKEQQYNHIIAQAAGVPDNAVQTTVQQGNGGSQPTAAAGRRHTLQALDQPLMLNSFITSSNPQQAQQSVNGVLTSGTLQQQLQGIGLNLVPGSANVGGQGSPSPVEASGSSSQPPTAGSPSPMQGQQSGAAMPSPALEQAAGQTQSAQAGSGGRRPGWQIAVIVIAVVVGVFLAITAVLVPFGLVRRNKRKQPQLQEKYPRSDQPQPANGRGGAAAEGRMSGGRSGGPDAGKRVLERGDDFERLPVPKAGRKTAGGGNEPLLQAGDSSFTSAKSVESFTSARSLPRDTGSFAGGASLPASSSGPSADADDTFYDPAGGNDSFLSTRSLGHSSTMSVDSFASAQSADREFFDSAEQSRRGSLDPQEAHTSDQRQPNRNANPLYGHEGSLPAAAAAAGAGAGAGMVARGRPDQAPLADKPPYSSGDRLTQGAMAGHPLTPDLSPRSDAWRPKSGNATPASVQGHPVAFDSGSAGMGSPAMSPKPSDDMGSVQGHPLTFDSGSEGPGSVFGSLPNSGQVTPRAGSMQGHPIGFDSGSDFGSPLGSSIRTPLGSGEVTPRAGSVQGHPVGFDSGSDFGSAMGSSANSPLGSGASTPRDLARMSPSHGHAGEAAAAGAGLAGGALSAVSRPVHQEPTPFKAPAGRAPETLSPAASQTIHGLTPVGPTRPAFPGTPRSAAPAPTPGRTVSFDIGHGPPRGPRQSMDVGADLAPGSELPSPVASRPTSMDTRPAAPPPSLAGRRNASDLSIGEAGSARGTPYSSRPSSMDYGPRAPPPSVRGFPLGSDLGSDVGSNIGSLPPSGRPSFDVTTSQRSLRGFALGSDLGSDAGSNIGSLPPSGRPSLDMTGGQHPSLRGYPLSSSSQRSLRGYALGSDLGSEVGSNIGSLPPSRQASLEVSGSQHPSLRGYPPGSDPSSRQGSGTISPESGTRRGGPPSVRGYALGSDLGSDMGSVPASGRPSFDIGEGRPSFDIGARPVRQSFDIGEGRPSFDFGGARAAGLMGHPLQGSGSLSALSETGLTPAPSRPGSLDYQLRAPPPSAYGSDIGSEIGSRPASLDYGVAGGQAPTST